jgi:hypothetical protein
VANSAPASVITESSRRRNITANRTKSAVDPGSVSTSGQNLITVSPKPEIIDVPDSPYCRNSFDTPESACPILCTCPEFVSTVTTACSSCERNSSSSGCNAAIALDSDREPDVKRRLIRVRHTDPARVEAGAARPCQAQLKSEQRAAARARDYKLKWHDPNRKC